MKSILFAVLFLLVPKLCISQISENDKKISLDSSWTIRINLNNYLMNVDNENPNQNQGNYRIIRNYKLNKSPYIINDYYKSGVLKCEGKSIDKDVLWRQGEFISYYENGNKKSVANFSYGIQEGKDLEFYENGNKKEERTYMENSKDGNSTYKINQFWNNNQVQQVIDGNGHYEEHGEKYFGSGKIENGFKNGVWQGWIRIPENKYTEIYENGKLVSGTIVDKNNIQTTYTVLEKKAQPTNGSLHFYNYLKKNIHLPNRFKNTTDGIYIEFTIDKEGKIVDPKIKKPTKPKSDEKAIKVLLSYEDWIPAEQRGQKATYTSSLPFSYLTLEYGPSK